MADLMRINILNPNGVNDRIDHLSYGPFADYLILNMFFLAILKADVRKYDIKGSFWH